MEVSSLGLDSSVLNNLVSDLGEEPDSQTGTEVRKNVAAAEAKLGNTISGMKVTSAAMRVRGAMVDLSICCCRK